MKRFLKHFRYGERGFTLIELLVVIAILGILAAVVVPNVTKFMGAGAVEAANTEAHNVQLGVVAYIADNSLTTCDGAVGPLAADDIGPADPLAVPPGSTVKSFLLNPAGLQAKYTIANGAIVSAIPETDGKWADLEYAGPGHVGEGWHKKTT